MLKNGNKIFGLAVFLLVGLSVAITPRTWDAIFGAEGEGDYLAAKIDGQIRFFKYTYYGEVQPIAFTVSEGNFSFVVSGNLKVPSDKVEGNFYATCNKTKEVWISCFNQPQKFGSENLVVNIKGIDLACDDDLYAIRDLRIKFKNEAAQTWWDTKFEDKEKLKRKQLADFRIVEQEQRIAVKDASGEVIDSRDEKAYRTIKIEGRTWIAENVNYEVPGESWCYEDKDSYCERGGRLYTLEGARQACPKGFHLPRDREWQDMLTSLTQCYDGVQNCGDFGAKLKAKTGWHGGGGKDAYGFTVFSSGRRDVVGKSGRFVDMGEFAGFWSAQNGSNETIWIWVLGRMGDNLVRQLAPSKNHAYSVRCIDGN